jgi:hypothetical protein
MALSISMAWLLHSFAPSLTLARVTNQFRDNPLRTNLPTSRYRLRPYGALLAR